MNPTENRTGAENGGAPNNITVTVRIRKTDLVRLERYQVNEDDTPAAVISRVIDMCDRDSGIIAQISDILAPKWVAKTDELITTAKELIDLLRSEKP